jgi:hypothetical protein
MEKILLLDWDGPVSNSRTWKMPTMVDPVAIQLLNDATKAGWKTVLTSTIRKHYKTVGEADEFMKLMGLNLEWYVNWRTPTTFTAKRHLEVLQWMSNTDVPLDSIFLVVDDERFPYEVLERGHMVQIHASSHAGIDYLSIAEAYRIFEMDDTQLAERFGLSSDDQG